MIALLATGGCEEDYVNSFEFGISTPATTYEAGEPVTFEFTGNPDFISFYSGETGKRYEYAGRASEAGTPTLQFTSQRANGSQEGSLQLMISQDFPGVTAGTDPVAIANTITNIGSSTWSNITDRAILSSGSSTASGSIDLSDFAQNGKPVFIAFKYLAVPGSVQNKWTISNLAVKNTLADGTVYTLANTTSAAITNYGVAVTFSPGWVFYKITNNYGWGLSSNNLIITGATNAGGATAEAWALMGPVDLTKVTPDTGLPVKGIETRLNSFSYSYPGAGTFTATFVGATNNAYGKKEIVKQIQITIGNP